MDDSYCIPYTYLSLNIVKRLENGGCPPKTKIRAEGFTRKKKFMHKQVADKKNILANWKFPTPPPPSLF